MNRDEMMYKKTLDVDDLKQLVGDMVMDAYLEGYHCGGMDSVIQSKMEELNKFIEESNH